MGCGPVRKSQFNCTNVTAAFHRRVPPLHIPVGHLQRFLEEEFMSRAALHECVR
jgi:hypothetical protein